MVRLAGLGVFRGTQTSTRLVGAPFPARADLRRGVRRTSVCRVRSRRPRGCGCGRVGSLPNYVVAWAAVPGVGPGLFATSPFRPGATHPAVVPFLPRHSLKIGRSGT